MTFKKPLISVLLPVYNASDYLSEALDSLISQTLSDFEIVAINDGSLDNSGQILSKYAKRDKRIKILTNPKNIGMAASLNRALPLAKGKYIARMDADDISLPDRFQKQITLLQSNPKLVAVGGQEEIIDQNGQVTAQKYFPINPQTCYQTLCNFMPIQPPLLMVRASVFKKIRYDVKICKNDDINIYFKLLKFGQISNIDSLIFQYRQLGNSLTHNNAKAVFFMALKNRLNGILKHHYRPRFSRLILLFLQTIVAFILPSFLIIKIFEFIRYSKDSFVFSYSPAKQQS